MQWCMTISGTLSAVNPLKEVASKELFTLHIGGAEIPFTNHMFMITLTSLLLMAVLPLIIRRRMAVPRGLYNVVETICVFLREDVARPFLKDRTDRYIGSLWTLFWEFLCYLGKCKPPRNFSNIRKPVPKLCPGNAQHWGLFFHFVYRNIPILFL